MPDLQPAMNTTHHHPKFPLAKEFNSDGSVLMSNGEVFECEIDYEGTFLRCGELKVYLKQDQMISVCEKATTPAAALLAYNRRRGLLTQKQSLLLEILHLTKKPSDFRAFFIGILFPEFGKIVGKLGELSAIVEREDGKVDCS